MRLIIIALVIVSAFLVLSEVLESMSGSKDREKTFPGWLQGIIMEPYLPGIHRMNRGAEGQIAGTIRERWLFNEYPVFLYKMETKDDELAMESDYERLMMLEGSDEDNKAIAQDDLEYGEDAMHLEQGLADALLAENGMYLENQSAMQDVPEVEEQMSANTPEGFMPVGTKSYSYRWEDLQEYTDLVKAFYAIDSTTKAGGELLNAKDLLSSYCLWHRKA